MNREFVTIDGNEAAAYVAYKTNEIIAIYPITPASTMGELAEAWAVAEEPNLWGTVPLVQEMQSEAGAAGAVHGALQTGALATTFTASQGLLLMIPNMYKIAGELTPTVFHIAARSVAAQGLSIFGDHSDVMATRMTGWGTLFANSVQEAMDFALIAQSATLQARIPFLHVFDGFRTSHEVKKIKKLADEDIRAMIDEEFIQAHRARALSPEHPVIRGTAQNPDVYFQARETVNQFYAAAPDIVQATMDRFASVTGREYKLFEYVGSPDAERVVIAMGSGCETIEETVNWMTGRGEKVGLVKVRLFRPFSVSGLLATIPESVRRIAVLDRTKEPGAAGEPLYLDVVTAMHESQASESGRVSPSVVGGRYGLSSKEFTPAMVKAVFDELKAERPKNHFTVGIKDDVTHSSIDYDPEFDIEPDAVEKAVFWGLGADGTVGANKNTIKIIGEGTTHHAQGYFVYDSKKSGARTVSHLRFGPHPIHSEYLIRQANFVAVHQFGFFEKYPVLENAAPGATLLINSPYGPDEVWMHLPRSVQRDIIEKSLKVYVINAYSVARAAGVGNRINTVMQICYFKLSGVMPLDDATAAIKLAIKKTYGKRGEAVVRQNFAAVDEALAHLRRVEIPGRADSEIELPPTVSAAAPKFVQDVTAVMMAGHGDDLPVSALPIDGTYPVGTTRWEKRALAQEIPEWESDLCIQCGKCVMVCPHAVIRAKAYGAGTLFDAPDTFKHVEAKFRELPDKEYTLQVSPDDCTGCRLCVEVCPVHDKSDRTRKALNMASYERLRDAERQNWEFFLSLPDLPRADTLKFDTVKQVQLLPPLFEFSGACSGCGETPYLRLLSQLFGDRTIVANATGCSSIFGGNLPTTPWTTNQEGRGPAWSNSLFEDNAEFGLGMRLTLDKQTQYARELLSSVRVEVGEALADAILNAKQSDEAGIERQRERVIELKKRLEGNSASRARDLFSLADVLIKRTVWIIGGDGWAYDIGFGGLDHVLASGRNVNLLVLDTEVYSNTGGQASKATPFGAVAKFAAGGKTTKKKDLGVMAMGYGNVYVAQISLGANDLHTLKAFREAEAHDGPSLIIAYGNCIAHGVDMAQGLTIQKLAVETGYWPLYRFNPNLRGTEKNPFQLDSPAPKTPLKEYIQLEARFSALLQGDPETGERLMAEAQQFVSEKWRDYERLAHQEAP
jgi:pyruvate-ferredoxin/flavodoxin oxidoreductase